MFLSKFNLSRTPDKKNEHTIREMVLLILFDFIVPILGVYPAVFVWFEYKDDDKLMYTPIPDLITVLLYFAFAKLILFGVKVCFIEMDYRSVEVLKRYPILE